MRSVQLGLLSVSCESNVKPRYFNLWENKNPVRHAYAEWHHAYGAAVQGVPTFLGNIMNTSDWALDLCLVRSRRGAKSCEVPLLIWKIRGSKRSEAVSAAISSTAMEVVCVNFKHLMISWKALLWECSTHHVPLKTLWMMLGVSCVRYKCRCPSVLWWRTIPGCLRHVSCQCVWNNLPG